MRDYSFFNPEMIKDLDSITKEDRALFCERYNDSLIQSDERLRNNKFSINETIDVLNKSPLCQLYFSMEEGRFLTKEECFLIGLPADLCKRIDLMCRVVYISYNVLNIFGHYRIRPRIMNIKSYIGVSNIYSVVDLSLLDNSFESEKEAFNFIDTIVSNGF